MEIILYIISALISHFIVETFIQTSETRVKKYDHIRNSSMLRKYAITYSLFVGIISMVTMCGIGIVYTDPKLFFCSVFCGIVYYTMLYEISVRIAAIIHNRMIEKKNIERIHIQWFINMMSILLFLVILNYITQI